MAASMRIVSSRKQHLKSLISRSCFAYSKSILHQNSIGIAFLQQGKTQCLTQYSRNLAATKPTFLTASHQRWCSSQSTGKEETIEGEILEEEEKKEEEEYHNIIQNVERGKGPSAKHEFQAETRKLLDIVAKSLYSEKEVFIRELISNCSDALEKLRYLEMTNEEQIESKAPLEIHIAVDDQKKTFTIQDTGVGMTKEEMIDNLGTIARSGAKAFLSEMENKNTDDLGNNIIGQFGVGFYSAFMVADKVEVFSKSYKSEDEAFKWVSDGSGAYEISEAENVQRGTKIVVHLKKDCLDFATEDKIKDVIKKYSNFVGVPIYLGGKRVNTLQALWTLDSKEITEEMHTDFYQFIANNTRDWPRYTLHYKADAPINIRAIFYVPQIPPNMWEVMNQRDTEPEVLLYSKKVMIMNKARNLIPKWLRFMRGVVDSEDIPLNLSRELLQDSALIRKLKEVLTNRIIRFFVEQAKKDPEKYDRFYTEYSLFFREGIWTTHEQAQREEIGKLLRFESSAKPPGTVVSLDDYISRMKAGDRNIYYFSVPSRQLVESSPYMEAIRKKEVEVLFCIDPSDEMVLMNLGYYNKKTLKSIESELNTDSADKQSVDESDANSLTQEEADNLLGWLSTTLGMKVAKTKINKDLVTHPCIISIEQMAQARMSLRIAQGVKTDAEKMQLFSILQPTLEINPTHPIIKKMEKIRHTDEDLAILVADQMYDNALLAAGLSIEDPRSMIGRLNDLISRALEKH